MTLTPFDGHPITETRIRITRAGDGLSEGLAVDPVELHLDDVVYVLLRGTVTKIVHETCGESAELRRVHVIRTDESALIGNTTADTILTEHRYQVEAAAGVQHLFTAGSNGHGE